MVAPLDVPRLVAGDRFELRAWELGDLALVREASTDDYIPLVTTVPAVYSREAGEAFVRRQWERASSGSGYPFVIVRVADGRPVGMVGLWLRELEEGRASLGYWVARAARGQGVAAEALRAVAAWALGDLRIPRLQLYVEPWNVASQRTAERVGFRREGLLRSWQQVGEERRDMMIYSMLDPDLSSPAERSSMSADQNRPDTVKAELDELMRLFFSAFTNTDGPPRTDRIHEVCIPQTTIISQAGDRSVVYDLDSFVAPRRQILTDGTLTEFSEWEVSERTEIYGSIAHRFSEYRKSGVQDGERFEGGGHKTAQFVRTPSGWRISSLAWEDD